MASDEKGVWFIDGRLLYKAAKDDGQFLHYKKLRGLLENEFGYTIRDAFYFDGAPQTDADRKRHGFLAHEAGFRVKTFEYGHKTTTCPNPACNFVIETRPQKCVDIAMAMAIIEYATKKEPLSYNPLIVSTGDRDFKPALEHIRDTYDKDIVLVAPHSSTSGELKAVTTRQIWIEDYYSSIASPWTPKAPRDMDAARTPSDEEEQLIPAEETLRDAKELLKTTWEGLVRHEKDWTDGRKARPWGYLLLNFGTACCQQHMTDTLQPFLVEQEDGRFKGANGVCRTLAEQIWPGIEIMPDDQGHPYMLMPK